MKKSTLIQAYNVGEWGPMFKLNPFLVSNKEQVTAISRYFSANSIYCNKATDYMY